MHDKHGNPLADGDTVLVECVITSHNEGEEYCNLNLETVEPMYPSKNKTTIVLNAKQVAKQVMRQGNVEGKSLSEPIESPPVPGQVPQPPAGPETGG